MSKFSEAVQRGVPFDAPPATPDAAGSTPLAQPPVTAEISKAIAKVIHLSRPRPTGDAGKDDLVSKRVRLCIVGPWQDLEKRSRYTAEPDDAPQ